MALRLTDEEIEQKRESLAAMRGYPAFGQTIPRSPPSMISGSG
jgi:hypothetical protein